MASLEELLGELRRQLALTWQPDVPPESGVWILWYDKALDRKVRGRFQEVRQTVIEADHGWHHLDLETLFPAWIAQHELLTVLLENPLELSTQLPDFEAVVAVQVGAAIEKCGENDLLAISGCGAVSGLLRLSDLIASCASHIRGRVMLLYPGTHRANVYRLRRARRLELSRDPDSCFGTILTMTLNRDVFQTDPETYRIANQGVAKISFPPPPEARDTLREELSTFVCDGHYAEGLRRILDAYLANAGRGSAPAVWISGFYGSGKSHLASMLAALWSDIKFSDGATAQGIVQSLPGELTASLP